MKLQSWVVLGGLLLIGFFVIAPIAGAIAIIDPLAHRGMNADLCNTTEYNGTATCQAQTNSLETLLDLAMSIAPITSVMAGACYDTLGGYRAGLVLLIIWCVALSSISIAPTVGALWAVATGIAGGAGGSLVQAMAYWHARQLFLHEERYYAVANTAFIVAFDTSGFFSIPLQRWIGWTAIPLRLVFPLYGFAVAIPAGFLLYRFGQDQAALSSSLVAKLPDDGHSSAVGLSPAPELYPLLVTNSEADHARHGEKSPSDAGDDDEKCVCGTIAPHVLRIVRTPIFVSHTFQIAVVLSFGTLCGSVIGTVYQNAGATHSEVGTVRTITPYAAGAISLWSLVVGRITGKFGAKRGVLIVDAIQAGTAFVGTGLLLVGTARASPVALSFGYFFIFLWRATGFPMLNLLWPVVFGRSSPRGIGIAGGLASTLGGACSAVVGYFSAHAVHGDPSRFVGVAAGFGGAAVFAGLWAALVMSHSNLQEKDEDKPAA